MGFNHMNNVTNNHDAPLAVAGVAIAAGATVGIDSDDLRAAMNSNGVKQWIKLGVIEVEGLDELVSEEPSEPVTAPVIPGVTPVEPTREQLEARATELGIDFQDNTRDSTLVKKIAEAEEAAE